MAAKGQVTIFIILAILLVSGVIVFFILKNSFSSKTHFSLEEDSIISRVDSCISSMALEGIKEISLKGGYYEVPSPKKVFLGREIPYYVYRGDSYILEKGALEESISDYLETNLPFCVKNISLSNYELTFGSVSVYSFFSENALVLKVHYPIQLLFNGASDNLNNFQVSIETNFYENFLLIREILNEQMNSPESIPLGFISSLAHENNFSFETFTFDEDVVYSFLFDSGGDKIPYSFAIKYFWDNLL
jgi:hypothetical protein